VNAVSPSPVTNAEFTKALSSALHRPALVPVPAFGMRLAFGEMANALLLASTRVLPARLQGSGFVFEDSEIRQTLKRIVNSRV
jgi:NAD dependent epimerase/dehydratase family enzyme